MGHVNPAACLPRKESWRWETTNSEYGKFYVRKTQREIFDGLEFQNDCSKKCEELTNELLEAKAELEKLKISCAGNNIRGPGLHDTACQTSPITPRPPSGKLYKTEKMNSEEGDGNQMLLGHVKEDQSHLVKHVRPKLPLLKLRNGRNINQRDTDDQDIREGECCKPPKISSGCGLCCGAKLESGSRSSSSSSAKDHGPPSIGKRKIWQKQGGAPKKQKGTMVRVVSSNLKHTAASGANLPLSQRYAFYRNFGYKGQGAKTSKGWHSKTSPWMPT